MKSQKCYMKEMKVIRRKKKRRELRENQKGKVMTKEQISIGTIIRTGKEIELIKEMQRIGIEIRRISLIKKRDSGNTELPNKYKPCRRK